MRRLMALRCLPLVGVLLGVLPLHAQSPGPRITRWRAAEGLPQSAVSGISIDPRGRIVLSHERAYPVSVLDGFQINTISNSAGIFSRAYLSRSDQLWSVHPQGLREQTSGGWTDHGLPDIATELLQRPARALYPPPLIPLDRNRTLVLLPDRLLEYDSGERRTTLLRTAAAGGLGRFRDLSTAADDGAWISAERGLLHIPGPLRQVLPSTPFETHPLPESLGIGALQRPFENHQGDVFMAGEELATRDKAVVRWSAGTWQRWMVPNSNLRQAWSGPDGELWGHTSGSLVRILPGAAGTRTEPVIQAGRIADVAVEPQGIAWLATSEGLFRIAPLPWRAALGFGTEPDPTLAVTSDRRGQTIALTTRAVHWLEGNTWRTTSLGTDPREDPREDLRAPGPILTPLADGGFIAWTTPTPQCFGPNNEPRPPPEAILGTHALGRLRDGALLLHRASGTSQEWLLFDGSRVQPMESPPDSLESIGAPAFALESGTGELWIGGENGLIVRRGDLWSAVEDSEDGALCGLELPDGRLLVGGLSSVREYDGRRWTVLRRGLDRVFDLHFSRDRTLWVAAGTGLYRFRDNAWLLFTEEEGLPVGAAYSVFEDGSGRLWAGTARGLYEWDARADVDPPRAEITSADLPEESGDTRALFVVGGTDRWRYTAAGRLSFSWRIDTEPWSAWRPAGSVQFTNLTAGTHRFFVRAMDPSGNVQPSETRMEFAVALPWFRDPRLVAAVGVVAVLILALAAQAILSYWRLRRSYAEVERLVAKRTAELEKANAELLLSQKMRALGTLAAGIAHDFNNLLSIIRGSAQLIETSLTDPDKARQRIQRIKTTVDQGAALVRAMLGYSRGGTAPRRELDPLALMRQAVRLLEDRLQSRVRLIHPTDPLPSVFAPPEMLQQILMNLIQNADDAMDHQGIVTLELDLAAPPTNPILKPPEASSYVALRVRDQGVGIPLENLPRIFEPFFTTKGFSSRRGTGLGLSMVYEFAKDLGAGIAVDSAVGEGSTFTILLPVTPHPPAPPESKTPPA
ncbi:MAG: hypothetical protein IT580_09100 [Verrucomicrobiales bacterium]|nr:hypothetical protein [Verrucomicrobiales bacterium]